MGNALNPRWLTQAMVDQFRALVTAIMYRKDRFSPFGVKVAVTERRNRARDRMMTRQDELRNTIRGMPLLDQMELGYLFVALTKAAQTDKMRRAHYKGRRFVECLVSKSMNTRWTAD
jgi:hypothetical protein